MLILQQGGDLLFTDPDRVNEILGIAAVISGAGVLAGGFLGFSISKIMKLMIGKV